MGAGSQTPGCLILETPASFSSALPSPKLPCLPLPRLCAQGCLPPLSYLPGAQGQEEPLWPEVLSQVCLGGIPGTSSCLRQDSCQVLTPSLLLPVGYQGMVHMPAGDGQDSKDQTSQLLLLFIQQIYIKYLPCARH